MSAEQPPGPHGNGYRKGPVLLRGGQVPRTTSDQRLLASGNEPDWVHGDPWRVMRIQSEFVEGFGALAEVGPAVSVFGSASAPKPSTNSLWIRITRHGSPCTQSGSLPLASRRWSLVVRGTWPPRSRTGPLRYPLPCGPGGCSVLMVRL